METKENLLELVQKSVDRDRFREHHWEGSFSDYLGMVQEKPTLARNAFQRLYDMVHYFGTDRYTYLREDYIRYKFFSDPIENGIDAVFGLDAALMSLVDFFKSAAHGYGTERR
ncbi:MAG: PrkA family serine protein kinase, partial [Planctomycetota bacterium]